jgi:hypothetical protein
MAVTKQTYTLTPTWTAAQHADLVRDAFIGAGLMTNWYDSFLSGTMENRILEVQYDPSKTYGRTYYWFIFTGGSMYLAVATGWNAITHVPTGTQYLDYYTATTNAITGHRIMYTWTTTTNLVITRYTSNTDSTFSWFVIRNGTSSTSNFHISSAAVGSKLSTWYDLNKVFFHHFLIASLGTLTYSGYIRFIQYMALRRSYHPWGMTLRGETNDDDYGIGTNFASYTAYSVSNFGGVGNVSIAAPSNMPSSASYAVDESVPTFLPVAFTNVNPAFATNVTPVFTGAQYSSFLFDSLPEDFGLSMHYANNTMAVQDTLVVSTGVEEWEMINVSNNATIGSGASPMFLARIV